MWIIVTAILFSLLSTNRANKKKRNKKYEIIKGVLSPRFSAESLQTELQMLSFLERTKNPAKSPFLLDKKNAVRFKQYKMVTNWGNITRLQFHHIHNNVKGNLVQLWLPLIHPPTSTLWEMIDDSYCKQQQHLPDIAAVKKFWELLCNMLSKFRSY